MKVIVIGNTVQTLKGLKRLLKKNYEVICVFGLPEEKLLSKVNSVDLSGFCRINNIELITNNNWSYLNTLKADLVICLGDSRIVPESVLNAHKVVGNHGAILPYVQGGASLVWGRMLNNGKWGVSIMELDKVVDSGKILVTKEFLYKPDCTMHDFVEMADNLTIDALFDYLNGNYEPKENKKWNVKIAKKTDSEFVVNILKEVIEQKKCIYLPPRRPSDGSVKESWKQEFVESFKVANNSPYPQWR